MGTKIEKQSLFKETKAKRQVNKMEKVNIIFWNVAGLIRRDQDFWKYFQVYDYVELLETWLDEIRYDRIKSLLPKGYNWSCQHAKKKHKK